MNFNEFVNAVSGYFTESLGDGYVVSLNEVRKNNGMRLTGLLLKKKGQKVTPNIYLNHFYEQYIEEGDFEAILQKIWNTYQEALESFDEEEFDFTLDWKEQKDSIVYRLVNYKQNEKKLEDIPFLRFLDLAITFQCCLGVQDGMISTIPVTNALMNHWKTDCKSLFQLANRNTPNYFPLVCNTLEDIIRKLITEEDCGDLLPPVDEDVRMYVVSNEHGINGATVMLYEEAFQNLTESLGNRLYILPSSIHELILIPYDEEIDVERLTKLVQEVNQTQVPYEDVLSNHAYLYQAQTRSFTIL